MHLRRQQRRLAQGRHPPGAEAKVQEGLEGEFSDGYDEEEADRAQTRQRGCLMESEGIQREEGARARRGQLFTVESSTMGG